MDINIGKILIQPKDNWNATTPYAYLNLVRYNKKLYICKSVTGAPAGTLPTNTSYYMETTQDGIDAQEIQLQKTATEIQWKRTGETTWTTLITLAAIKGDKGDTGAKGDKGLKGDQGLKGDTGAKGDKGDPVPNTIWQYSADNITWTTSVPDGVRYMRESTDNGTTWSTAIELPSVAALALKANITDVDDALALKADTADVADALDLKAPLASPTFTGDVIVPDQTAGNNSTKAANTKYVDAGLGLKADLTYTEYLMMEGDPA